MQATAPAAVRAAARPPTSSVSQWRPGRGTLLAFAVGYLIAFVQYGKQSPPAPAPTPLSTYVASAAALRGEAAAVDYTLPRAALGADGHGRREQAGVLEEVEVVEEEGEGEEGEEEATKPAEEVEREREAAKPANPATPSKRPRVKKIVRRPTRPGAAPEAPAAAPAAPAAAGAANPPPPPPAAVAPVTAETIPFSKNNLFVLAATGGIGRELSRNLYSVERFMPTSYVALIADEGISSLVSRYLADTPLRMRVYSWERMRGKLPPQMQHMQVNEQRMFINSMVIEDYQSGFTKYPQDVIWSKNMGDNAPVDISAVGLVDARDVIFQGDVWPPLWEEVVKDYNAKPAGGLPGVLVVTQEPAYMTIGKCPYNAGWIEKCYGRESTLASEKFHIICSGTIFGTIHSVNEYVKDILVPACINCMEMNGWEQGPHNFLLHYSEDPSAYTPLLGDSRAAPTIELAKRMVSHMRVVIAKAEEDWMCTVGYFHNIKATMRTDAQGYILAQNSDGRCKLMHQFDRFPWIWEQMDRIFPMRN